MSSLMTNRLCTSKIAGCLVAFVKNDILLLVHTGNLLELGFPKCNAQKNDQKPRCSSSMVIETHHFKTLSFLPHGYYTPRLKNIAILAIVFSPHNFKILPICYMEHFWISNPTSFFCR